MATSVVMPALELAQETGKLVAWKKQEGDTVTKGEPLLEVETDKAVVEIEAPANGILGGITAKVGDDVPVGQTIAWLVAPGEGVPAAGAAKQAQSGRTGAATSAGRPQVVPAASDHTPAPSAPRLSPKARRLAHELGIDLRSVHGTGPGGEVLAADVEAASGARGAGSAGGSAVEAVGQVWRLMAERTQQSWTTVPHFFLVREVDVFVLVERRAALKERGVTYTDFLVALVARVLQQHPRLNASWTPQGIQLHEKINIGLAVDAGEGVVVVVFRNPARHSVETIAGEREALAGRARSGRATPGDLAQATFTISNLGMRRIDAFTAIINPPQAAILAVGSIVERVVAMDGQPTVRPTMTLTLSSDHRVIDGARAASFMDDLASAIGDPDTWLT